MRPRQDDTHGTLIGGVMQRKAQTGFTLLEVIVATVLLAVCFGALMAVVGSSMNLASRASGYTQSSLWARSKLDRAFIVDFPPAGVSEGRFDRDFDWRMRVSLLDGQVPAVNIPMHLYQIDLDVGWQEGTHHLLSHFSTFRVVAARPAVITPIRTESP